MRGEPGGENNWREDCGERKCGKGGNSIMKLSKALAFVVGTSHRVLPEVGGTDSSIRRGLALIGKSYSQQKTTNGKGRNHERPMLQQ